MIPKTLVIACVLAATSAQVQIQPRQSACASVPSWMTGDRIVGGETASSPIPWQVSLRQGSSGFGHFCGGTILDSKTILSAAHCFPNGLNNHYVMAGAVSRNNGGQTIKVASLVQNTEMAYNSQTLNNDYIILKLESDLQFNNDVTPACLPDASYDPGSGKTCFVSGWGTQSSGANSLPTNLQWVGVPTVTNSQCAQSYGNSITSSMLCAGFPQGGKDSCQGDSGGPFVCNENGQAIITGVVSWGAGCAAPNYPGVYARVTTVLDWIKNNMESGSGTPPGPTPAPTPAPTAGPTNPPSGCGSPQWATDQFCDDENNNEACNYDGGACCDNDADGWDNYCKDCSCLEPTDTTLPPKGGCGSPEWADDDYCDDENNNEACNWDGGACCNQEGPGWDAFCKDCLCLDPAGPGTDAPCEDNWPTKKCQRRKNKGKCNKPKVAANCALTCELC